MLLFVRLDHVGKFHAVGLLIGYLRAFVAILISLAFFSGSTRLAGAAETGISVLSSSFASLLSRSKLRPFLGSSWRVLLGNFPICDDGTSRSLISSFTGYGQAFLAYTGALFKILRSSTSLHFSKEHKWTFSSSLMITGLMM